MFNQKTLILVAFTCLLFSSALTENVGNNNSTQNRSRFPQRQRRCSPTEVCVGLEIDINLNLCATDGTIYILFKNECQRRVRTCKTGIDYVVVDISLCLGLPPLPNLGIL
ncbi:hypothetical protein LSTR_LSTR003929 [Laodelphax striatellus]|uniref:Kazal-like domain-containing protein n=1 Tax=Laodelphax striatellus TaxID=195883 RepID=A0A482XAI3_LAOST|nr:hypothetical protein LSTR_LSTR003929 [Laodelphax striatellus]